MQPITQDAALRRSLLLIVGLIAVSTVLFVVGVTIERRGEATESAVHQDLSGEPAGSHEKGAGEGGEAGEAAQTHGEAGAQQEAGESSKQGGETILGINPDATPVVVAVVIGWLMLAAALLLLGPRALILIVVALAAAAATVFDVAEVARQLQRADATVAILAALVVLGHAAIAVLSALLLRRYGSPRRQDGRLA